MFLGRKIIARLDHLLSKTNTMGNRAENMRKIFVKIERNLYLRENESKAGHGFDGFVQVGQGDSASQ